MRWLCIKTILLQALKGIVFKGVTVPVWEFKYTGSEKTYITYQLLIEPVPMYADDEEEGTVVHFTVDLYTNNSAFEPLKREIRKRLRDAGFIISRGPETYENDTALYHIVTDCSIENLLEEE